MKQTLAASLQASFRDIVEAQCDSDYYVDLQGKRIKGQPRGRILTSFKPVAIAWLHLYASEEDVYEVTLHFIQNHILMNTDKVPVEADVHCFKDVNKLLEWCLSRKHLPNAPEVLPAPRKLIDFELRMHGRAGAA